MTKTKEKWNLHDQNWKSSNGIFTVFSENQDDGDERACVSGFFPLLPFTPAAIQLPIALHLEFPTCCC